MAFLILSNFYNACVPSNIQAESRAEHLEREATSLQKSLERVEGTLLPFPNKISGKTFSTARTLNFKQVNRYCFYYSIGNKYPTLNKKLHFILPYSNGSQLFYVGV